MPINEARINNIESRLNNIEMRFNIVDTRLNNLDSHLSNVEKHLTTAPAQKEPINQDIMNELRRSHTIAVVVLCASVAIAGIMLAVHAHYAGLPYPELFGWIVFAIIGIGPLVHFYIRRRNK